MMKRLFRKLNQQRGSATIEACISFTGFLFVIFTILGTVNFCRTQMMISNAVDTAARELSQYAYFYKMSGLQKFSSDLSGNAEVGKENINSVIGTVDHLYSSVGSAKDQGVQSATDLYNATTTGNLDMATIETAITNIDTAGTNVVNNLQSVESAFKDVADDPLLYMRSLVAIAGEKALDTVKSHLIAVPLSKLFVRKHFGGSYDEADARLEALGVKDGLDGMNFNLSTVFSSDAPNDIQIVVLYRIEILQVFDWTVLEAGLSKVAVTSAWLGGDNVQTTVKSDSSAAANSSTNTGMTESTESTESTDPTEETTPVTEPTEATEPATADQSTGYWALTNSYYMSKRIAAFQDKFEKENLINAHDTHFQYYDMDTVSAAYDFDVCVKWPPLDPVKHLTMDVKMGMDDIANTQYLTYDGKPIEMSCYLKTIYVPENMPQDQLDQLYADIRTATEELEAYAESIGLEDFSVSIMVNPSEGTFDYENGQVISYELDP